MKEIQDKILDDIFKYITECLNDCIDEEIFRKSTFDELGEFYYNKIITEVNGATSSLINEMINCLAPRNTRCESQKEYYLTLCKVLYMERLPAEIILSVTKEFDEIFIQKYDDIIKKKSAEISKINSELNRFKQEIETAKHTSNANLSFTKDISYTEQKLYEIYSKCKEYNTRKERLEFIIDNLKRKLFEFCNFTDSLSVDNALKKETINICKNSSTVKTVFSAYRSFVELAEDNIDRPYALFFKIKIYIAIETANKKYYSFCHTDTDEFALQYFENFVNSFPKIDDLQQLKENNRESYDDKLKDIIDNYGYIEKLTENLNSSVCLRNRKDILMKVIELYTSGEYELFNNILPIQIEGMFADFLKDTTTFARFKNMELYNEAVLREKIKILNDVKSDIYDEATEYFRFYFNSMIRNMVAHGRYQSDKNKKIDTQIFANELLMDMCTLVHMLSRKSETEKMFRFISKYQDYYENRFVATDNPCYEPLFNDMIGEKIIRDYDSIERYSPIQVTYWLVNPYYEKIYEQVADKQTLLNLRAIFLSEGFWQFVYKKIDYIVENNYIYHKVDLSFLSVVNGLFKCGITTETKRWLIQVQKLLIMLKQKCP